MCGEHSWIGAGSSDPSGSSPRVRGTLDGFYNRLDNRFIPACAGNNALGSSPRVRGTSARPTLPISAYRSSPRVRGTSQKHYGKPLDLRFIPACAGNISPRSARPSAAPVHPRVCGEHQTNRHPAVHPRVCGEHPKCHILARLRVGSSPRVRGTYTLGNRSSPAARFIPACAGNIWAEAIPGEPLGFFVSVHPRVCGEHMEALGKQSSRDRFIPACAGNIRRDIDVKRIDWVRFIPACAGNICNASNISGPPACRFIPACAGNIGVLG